MIGKKGLAFIMAAVLMISMLFSGNNQEVKAAEDTVIKVACLGDSITYGDKSSGKGYSYPEQLQKLLGEGYEVRNYGINGATMTQSSWCPKYLNTNQAKQCKEWNPDIVIIMLGTNDSQDICWINTDGRGKYEATARELIETCKNYESKPSVYIASSPTAGEGNQFKIRPDVIKDEIVPLQKKLAEEMGCGYIDIHNQTADFQAVGLITEQYNGKPDLVHPNNDGYFHLAQLMFNGLCQSTGKEEIDTSVYELDVKNSKVTYSGQWGDWNDEQLYMNSEKYTTKAGSAAELAFQGVGIEIMGIRTSGLSYMDVYIDGQFYQSVDTYIASGALKHEHLFAIDHLPYGEHTVKVVLSDRMDSHHNSAAGPKISLDSFRVLTTPQGFVDAGEQEGSTWIDNNSDAVKYTGTWEKNNDVDSYDGTIAVSHTQGDKLKVEFTGTHVQIIGKIYRLSDWSSAKVWIDGTRKGTATFMHNKDDRGTLNKEIIYEAKGLSEGKHTLELEVQSNAAGAPSFGKCGVALDGFRVYQQEPPVEENNKFKIACVGDSISYGACSTDPQTKAYSAVLQTMLGEDYDVRNYAMPSACLHDEGGFAYTAQSVYWESLRFQPDCVIIMLGTNDATGANWKGKEEFRENLIRLTETYRGLASQPDIYLATPLFTYDNGREKLIESDIAPAIVEVAKEAKYGLIDLNTQTKNLDNDFFVDGIHLNDEGYYLMAKLILEGLPYEHNFVEKIKVACVGDSITFGYGASDRKNGSYPAHLQRHLGDRYEVKNFGVSGRVMNDQKGWESYVSTSEYKRSKAFLPDIVIIMLGTNDSKDHCWDGKENYTRSANKLIDTYQGLISKPLIYIATSPAVADDELMKEKNEGEGNYIWNSRIKSEIVPLQKQIAKEQGCRLIDINAHTEELTDLYEYLSQDLIHPHDQGYELLGNWMFEGLQLALDTAELQQLIAEAEGLSANSASYTEETWAVVANALENAQKIMNSKVILQEDYQTACERLKTAIDNLEKVEIMVDKTTLGELIEKADAVVKSKYTKETVEVFEDALAYAKEVYAKEKPSEEEVKDAEAKLRTAQAGLKEIQNPDKEPDKNPDKDPGKEPDKNPDKDGSSAEESNKAVQTGDSTNLILWLGMLLLAGAAGCKVYGIKRDKKQ